MKSHHYSFDKCPACGSTERIVAQADKELQDAGRIKVLPNQRHVPGLPLQVALGAPSALMSQQYVLRATWDICAKCGAPHYVEADLQDVPIQVQVTPSSGRPA